MNYKQCNYCASKNIRADRALGGRFVCMACGKIISSRSVNYNLSTKYSGNNRIIKFVLIALVIFIFIIVI